MQERALEKKSPSPLYQQLMTRLKNDIVSGAYPAGGRIPSEQSLCQTYDVSRVTVRKAMFDLVQEGLLVRRQGKGTFVAEERLQRDLAQITSFTDACAQKGHRASARVVSISRDTVRPEESGRLGPEGAEALEITRVRLCDDEPVMLEINRFPIAYAFLEGEELSGSLYDALKQRGVMPSRAVHDISLGHATPLVGRCLQTQVGQALLVLDETVLDQHGDTLHLSRQWIRGDRFTFRI